MYGNLKTQWHNGQWRSGGQTTGDGPQGQETYVYDSLHRLTSLTRTGNGSSASVAYSYDTMGRLQSKSDFGNSYVYQPNSHRIQSVLLTDGQTQCYGHDANGNVTTRTARRSGTALQYDIDNLPRTISSDSATANFYSAPGGRYLQRLNSRDTWYLGKAYEREVKETY